MKTLALTAAALVTLSCTACHSEETRKKIDTLEAERTTQPASNADAAADAQTNTDSATTDGNTTE